MKIKTQFHQVVPPVKFIERGDSSLIEFSDSERGIKMRSYAGGSAEISGEIVDGSSAHGTVTKGMLRLFRHAVSKWSAEINEERWIVVELGRDRLSAFPLDYPMFLVSIPLRRALESKAGNNEWTDTVIVNTGENLDVFRDLIRRPSRREPNEGITRIEIEPYVFNMYSFDGHVLAHHQTYVRSDGHLESDVANVSLKQALSTELRDLGSLEVRHREDALSLSREGFEVIVDGAHSPTFESALWCFECEVEHSRIEVNTERLLDLCQGAVKVGSKHIEIVPHEGIARIADTTHMQARGYRLPSEREEKKVGIAVQVIEGVPPWGEIESLIVEANDVVAPLKVLLDDDEVALTVVGDAKPDYIIVRGYEEFPRFGIRINTRIGG